MSTRNVPIDRAEVESSDLVEQYVAGKLAGGELERFEEHLMWCEETRRDVDAAERLASGLRIVARDRQAPDRVSTRVPWRTPALAAAASAVLAVGATLLVTGGTGPAMPVLTTSDVVYLEPVRSADAGAPELVLNQANSWVTLVLYPDFAELDRYRVVLERRRGEAAWTEVWSGNSPGGGDALAVTVRRALVVPGDYRVRVFGAEAGGRPPAAETRFRIGSS